MTHPIALLRLVAQRLVGPPHETPAEAVRWLTAVQAQDHPGSLLSVALRIRGRSRAEVLAALDSGDIVKSWPMRGTLHLVAAEDLPWLVELLTPRVVSATRGRRAGLGLDDTVLERAREVAVDALTGGRRLTRKELYAAWAAAGLETSGQRGVHLLGYLALTGTVCLGPTRDGQPLVVLVDEWIPSPRRLQREQALGELALRYFRSHGPATVADLARWAGLPMKDARAGLALAEPELATIEQDGSVHHLDPATPELLRAVPRTARRLLLLPGFDEYLLGYGDRSAMLAPEHAEQIVPGGNGMFRPTIVLDGRVVGTWGYTGRGPSRTAMPAPFTPLPPDLETLVAEACAVLP